MNPLSAVGAILALFLVVAAHADEINVAVAANFSEPMHDLAADFAKDTGHQAKLTFGSSGKIFAQISNGAPFGVFLSADQTKPAALEAAGLAVLGSRFTYSIGALALWSAKVGWVDDQGAVLTGGQFNKLAIANPKLAPYGQAAEEVLTGMGLFNLVAPKLVQGENIAQTYQFVHSGNADLGFVALSQVMKGGKVTSGSAWIVPGHLHTSIRQDAILLKSAQDNPAAHALIAYLKSEKARAIIQSYGYRF